MFESSSWGLLTVLGPVILAVVFIYVFMRRRSLTRGEKVARHQAVEELYHDTPADRAARDAGEVRERPVESRPRP